MVEAGCATFKLYQAYAGMMLDDVSLLRAFQSVAAAGAGAVLHSEAGPILDELRATALAAGHREAIWHERTRPSRLEASAIRRAAILADMAGCPLLIFHIGCAEGVRAIAEARSHGTQIAGETCPHYLTLSAEEHLGGPDGNLFVCAPPLRSQVDQDAIWRALADGVLEVISTDHCPWTRTEKAQPDFVAVPGGVPGIEARLALIHHFGVRSGRLSPARWVELCCTNPARLMGLNQKGRLHPGCDADIVIFDPNRRRRLSVDTLHEAVDWTPYAGFELQGWPRTVLLRGRPVVDNGRYIGHSKDGRFVKRSLKS